MESRAGFFFVAHLDLKEKKSLRIQTPPLNRMFRAPIPSLEWECRGPNPFLRTYLDVPGS